jgi:hypothetical protein
MLAADAAAVLDVILDGYEIGYWVYKPTGTAWE